MIIKSGFNGTASIIKEIHFFLECIDLDLITGLYTCFAWCMRTFLDVQVFQDHAIFHLN